MSAGGLHAYLVGQNPTPLPGWPAPQITVNPANNRITTAGYIYDAAGNVINDTFNCYTYKRGESV
jgi:hypothetical protein